MSKMNELKLKLKQNSPAIKAGVAVGGVVSTTTLAVAVTPEAHKRLQDILERDHGCKKTIAKRVIKEVAPLYIPTAISAGLTIYCIMSGHKEMSKRNAVLAGLYTASEGALQAYQKKAIDKLGEKWHEETTQEINKELIQNRPCTIIPTGGKVLCYDKPSDRYWPCDMQTIRKAQNDVNFEVNDNLYETVNNFYTAVGLDAMPLADDKGWSQQAGLLHISFDAQLNDNDEPVLVIDYATFPIW